MAICQSCAMPLKYDPEGGGSEADGSRSAIYCSRYMATVRFNAGDDVGAFQAMVVDKMVENGWWRPLAYLMTRRIPKLERWSKKVEENPVAVSVRSRPTGFSMTESNAIPLPEKLARHTDWHRGGFDKDRDLYRDLVENGQHPEAMVVSCCDSRVHSMQIMGGHSGDFFIHRNIANLIPP